MNPLVPSFNNMMFNITGLKNVYVLSSSIEFLLIWVASILILKPYASKIGRSRFWFLMIIPNIYFISKFQFSQQWLSNFLLSTDLLSPVSFLRFASLFELSANVIGALVFGLSYWIVSRRISHNSLRKYVQISGLGICILFLSSQITNLTLLPYPPFGLISISFASISSYLLFIGLYQSAIITSKDSVIRSLIRKSTRNELRFIDNIGTSEMKHNITSRFNQVIKKFGDEIVDETNYEINDLEQDVKSFVAMALQEREKYYNRTNNIRLYEIHEFPFGKPWEKWVERWWQWCYSFPEDRSPITDISGRFCKMGKVYDSVLFLAGTFGGKAERSCIISKEYAIFFPIINDIVSFYTDPQLKTQFNLDAYSKTDLDHIKFLSATLDGHEIPNLQAFRVHSHLFSINIPGKDNKKSRVETEAVSDGYWLFLKPLSPGRHKLEFKGEKLEFDKIKDYEAISDNDVKDLPIFRVEVTYNLQVI